MATNPFAGQTAQGSGTFGGGGAGKSGAKTPSTSASKGKAATPPPGDLQSTLSALGINVDLSGGGGSTDDPNDLPVLIANPRRRGWTPLSGPHTKLTSEALLDIYNLPTPELIALQKKLYKGGFYGSSVKETDIPFGVIDTATEHAWETAVKRAANTFAAGNHSTLTELVDKSAANMPASILNGTKRDPNQVVLDNPQDLHATMEKVVLARNGKKDEALVQQLVNSYLQLETDYQNRVYETQVTGGTITKPPSASTYAEEQFRAQRPNEHAASEIGNAGRGVLGLLRGEL